MDHNATQAPTVAQQPFEEFLVVELDERLEFQECCDFNKNCQCPAPPPPPPQT